MTWFAVAVLGAFFGSFTNVLIARVPRGRSTITGRSECTRCAHQIAWYDNIPVVSWLVLRGKCRSCGEPISVLYPAVELAVALLWVVVYATWGLTFTAAVFGVLAPVSVALVAIDVQHHRLPHRIVLPSLAIVLVLCAIAWLVGERETWWSAVVGLSAMGGFYATLWFVYPKGMGFGDVTTACLLGFAAGFLGYPTLAVAAIAGPLLGGVMVMVIAIARGVTRGVAIPYGPALLGGAWIGFLGGPLIWSAYVKVLGVS